MTVPYFATGFVIGAAVASLIVFGIPGLRNRGRRRADQLQDEAVESLAGLWASIENTLLALGGDEGHASLLVNSIQASLDKFTDALWRKMHVLTPYQVKCFELQVAAARKQIGGRAPLLQPEALPSGQVTAQATPGEQSPDPLIVQAPLVPEAREPAAEVALPAPAEPVHEPEPVAPVVQSTPWDNDGAYEAVRVEPDTSNDNYMDEIELTQLIDKNAIQAARDAVEPSTAQAGLRARKGRTRPDMPNSAGI